MSSDCTITANFVVTGAGSFGSDYPAKFIVSNSAITPDSAKPGEEVIISALITNTGDLTGSFGVTLRINGFVVETKGITLAGGGSQTISFSTTPNSTGTHIVEIDGLIGTFEVIPSKGTNWCLIIGTIAGIIIIFLLVYWKVRQKAIKSE